MQCDICDLWIHRGCNFLSKTDYEYLKQDAYPFFCICCISKHVPFSNLDQTDFKLLNIHGLNISTEISDNTDLKFIHAREHLSQLNEHVNIPKHKVDKDDENDYPPNRCNYFDPAEFCKAKFNPNKSFSILHLNIHSFELHKNELEILLSMLDYQFDILAICESKLQKNVCPKIDLALEGYQNPISTPTEATKGGVLLYVSYKHSFKPREDLLVYEQKLCNLHLLK